MGAYLDNSATTKVCEKAKNYMLEALESCWGNPSSLHEKGIEADNLLLKARETVAKALSCEKDEILFTSGGTEGNNLAVFGAAYGNKRKGNRVITSAIEHPSVQKAFDRLEKEGFEVIRIGTDAYGEIDFDALTDAVNEKTVLVSIMAVNNEVGTIQPVDKIASVIKRKNSPAFFHIDAVQAFGKIPLNVKKLGADLMTVSSHKIHGPKGVGALFIKKGTKLTPVTVGGGQERDIRPGTEPMPAIAGFMGAVEELTVKASLEKTTALRDSFIGDIAKREGIVINSPADALPYIINLSLPGYRSETLLNFLSDSGFYVSSGSACAKGHKSHVLTAMKLPDSLTDSSLRISLSRFTTDEELDSFLEALDKAMKVIMKK
ncbi:MAG: cysteine desulfurase [Clostridia bacterium]|nr:cysteine desulfurase [Clostridia bacterium]